MTKKILISASVIVTSLVAGIFGVNFYTANKMAEYLASEKAKFFAVDKTSTLSHGKISYSMFDSTFKIEKFEFGSMAVGYSLDIDELTFSYSLYNHFTKSIPSGYFTSFKGGKLGLRSTSLKMSKKSEKIYNHVSGGDRSIDFSGSFKSKELGNNYEVLSDIYIENIGTLDLSVTLKSVDLKQSSEGTIGEFEKLQSALQSTIINDFSLSLTTENLKGIADNLFNFKDIMTDESKMISDLDILSRKMEQDPSLKLLAKLVRDFSSSYFSGRELMLTLDSSKQLNFSDVSKVVALISNGETTPLKIKEDLGVSFSTKIK